MPYKTNGSQKSDGERGTFRLAQALGVFSLGLGVAELIWGGAIARRVGLQGVEKLVRAYGGREVANGVLILAAKDPTPWIGLRVAGDALDAATLVWGYTRDPRRLAGVLASFAAVTPVVIADIYAAVKLSREGKANGSLETAAQA